MILASSLRPSSDGLLALQTLNVSDICAYVPSLPGIPWGRMAEICTSTVSPVYHAVKDTIAYDVENLTQLMAELDAHSMSDWDVSVCEVSAALHLSFSRS